MHLTQIFPGIETVNVNLLNLYQRKIGLSMDAGEVMSLCAIVRFLGARKVAEIGTYDGNTTLNLAANVPEGGCVTTIDLPPDWDRKSNSHWNVTDRNRIGIQYRGTAYENRVRQVLGDSATVDWNELHPPFDLIFIDGCHYRDYVKADTANALRNIRPGGDRMARLRRHQGRKPVCLQHIEEQRMLQALTGTPRSFGRSKEKVRADQRLTVERKVKLARVSRASYYRSDENATTGPDPDMDLRDAIQRIALEWPTYGRRRMTKELRRRGWAVNPKRVYRIMRGDNLLCLRKRKFVVTTDSSHGRKIYPNRARKMVLTGMDQLWRADLTYIRLREFVYLAVILDAYSRAGHWLGAGQDHGGRVHFERGAHGSFKRENLGDRAPRFGQIPVCVAVNLLTLEHFHESS
ncbi:MAG: IS3 family transposase [Bryobacteraceae bacterium]